MGVVPSLVVTLADQLEGLGAIERVRDPDDRRRHRLGLTEEDTRCWPSARHARVPSTRSSRRD